MYNPQIKTFIVVADAGSFNKAAEQLFVSSTAIIKQMNLLEDHVGVRLFNRSHRGLSLTEAGEVFYKDAKHIIQYSENTIKRVTEIDKGVSDTIRIGSSPITPVQYLIGMVPELQEAKVQFQIVPYENTPENARQILDNLGRDIDVVMGIYDKKTFSYYEKAECITIERLPLLIMMSKNDTLVTKESLDWDDLSGRRLYLLGSNWSKIFDQMAQDIQIHHPDIELVRIPFLDTSIFNQWVNNKDLFVGFSIWQDVHPLITFKDMAWQYEMDYGVLYSKEPTQDVKDFLQLVKESIQR